MEYKDHFWLIPILLEEDLSSSELDRGRDTGAFNVVLYNPRYNPRNKQMVGISCRYIMVNMVH